MCTLYSLPWCLRCCGDSMVMRQLRLDPSVWAWMLVSTAGTVVDAW